MSNQWLRLWHDMPTDPKWRTISKASGQRIGDVMAVYVHLLVCASNADERGRTQSFSCEDVASALDLETEQVTAIVDAMQKRVLDGDKVAGWEKRQVNREDGSAERAKAWREAKKAEAERAPNAGERKQTPDKDKEEIREEQEIAPTVLGDRPALAVVPKPAYKAPNCPHEAIQTAYAELLPTLPQLTVMNETRKSHPAARWKEVCVAEKFTAEQGIEWFRWYFGHVAKSPFLCGRGPPGRNGRVWRADFDWLLLPTNFAKVVEGRYHGEAIPA